MLDQFLNSLSFVGMGLGAVAVVFALESVLRVLTNRFAARRV